MKVKADKAPGVDDISGADDISPRLLCHLINDISKLLYAPEYRRYPSGVYIRTFIVSNLC